MNELNGNYLLKCADALKQYTCEAYHYLHRHPETAHHEVQTHRFIRKELESFGIPYDSPAENITIALIRGAEGNTTVGLRCDTDALPIREETGLEFASETAGVMHACGHDGHTACALTAARILNDNRDRLSGTVKIIFQPAEEGEPGADEVIATGLVDDVDVFFALHLWSLYPTGTLHVSPVTVAAAVNMFTVTIEGSGGHGAAPENCRDPLVTGAEIVTALQTLVSRCVSPFDPAVVTIGSFISGSVGNIIPQTACLKGTIRSLSKDTRKKLCDGLKEIAEGISKAHGCKADIQNDFVSDALQNDETAVRIAKLCAEELVDKAEVLPQKTMMLGDDFANYSRIAPICYAQVGIADEAKQTNYPHHMNKFRIDEAVLPVSSAWLASFAYRALNEWNAMKK